MHTQKLSVIKHVKEKHNIPKFFRKIILRDPTVSTTSVDLRKLLMSEAVLIRELRPMLISQNEYCERTI